MKCKFTDCLEPKTERVCVVCKNIAHHVCSNEYLYLRDISSSETQVFCGEACVITFFNRDERTQSEKRNINIVIDGKYILY